MPFSYLAHLRCPRCHAPLAEAADALRCQGCEQRYPLMQNGAFPVLVPEPKPYLAENLTQFARFGRERRGFAWMIDEALAAHPWRETTLRPLHSALLRNLETTDSLGAEIAAQQSPEEHAAAGGEPHDPTSGQADYGPELLGFVQTDWSDAPEMAAQRATVMEKVGGMLDRFSSGGPALLLGGGAGRAYYDLAPRFERLMGCDLCYTYVSLYHRVQRAPVPLAEIHFPTIASDVVATPFVAQRPAADGARTHDAYFVADATRLPVADASQRTVISIYFSDCVPFPALVRELHRVLEPNGTFVSYGPMIHRSVPPTGWFTPSEVMAIARQAGFECEFQEWSELPFRESPHHGIRTTHRVWAYTLRKRG